MQELYCTVLKERAILSIEGSDATPFLQGLISNDISKVSPSKSIFAAFLSPQGKYQFDFFIAHAENGYYLDCERERLSALLKRLQIFKLRADVNLFDQAEKYKVYAIWGHSSIKEFKLNPIPGSTHKKGAGIIMVDPRSTDAGLRIISKSTEEFSCNAINVDFAAYDLHRIQIGLTDGIRDLILDKTVLLEANFDELNGIDWKKGCYIGQELTARTKYRGLIKRRFIPVKFEKQNIEPGTPIFTDMQKVGEIRSVADNFGMAILRLADIKSNNVLKLPDNSKVHIILPNWMKL